LRVGRGGGSPDKHSKNGEKDCKHKRVTTAHGPRKGNRALDGQAKEVWLTIFHKRGNGMTRGATNAANGRKSPVKKKRKKKQGGIPKKKKLKKNST